MNGTSVKRRGGGKPNRGGGRANRAANQRGGRGGGGNDGQTGDRRGRGRGQVGNRGSHDQGPPSRGGGGVGGKSGRKLGSLAADDDYYDDYGNDYDVDYDDEEENEMEVQGSSGKGADFTPSNPKPKLKVSMQILHMSEESKKLAEKTLTELRGSNYQIKRKKDYRDTGRRLDQRFWIKDQQLLVRGVHNETPDNSEINYKMKTLENFGFHSSRCQQALEGSDGDVGKAIQNLAIECFNVKYPPLSEEDDAQMLHQEKEDEKMALESIYIDNEFNEKIPNKLWEIKLSLPHLIKYIPTSEREKEKKKKLTPEALNDKSLCKFYLNGHCRYGDKCRKKHKDNIIDDRHLQREVITDFYLEIRFPEPCVYPAHSPCILLRTDISDFPKQICLKLSAMLMKEAKKLSSEKSPAVFSLVSLLENSDQLRRVVKGPDNSFSFNADFIPDKKIIVEDPQAKLFAGLSINPGKPETKEEYKVNMNKVLDTNKRLKKRINDISDDLMKLRKNLPAWKSQNEILEALKTNQIVIISGMTGCGKSTQVPQYILDDWLSSSRDHCNVIVTQPRRLSAMGVADRVSYERNEKTGNVVGYQIRLESKTSQFTRLLFCTTGILLRRLEGDPTLESITHIIVDEVHERSEESDFLLMILRDLVKKNKKLKIILMSATLNSELFKEYFHDLNPPVIEIPGRTFPVQQFFLEEIIDMTNYAMEEGSTYARPVDYKSQKYMDVIDDDDNINVKLLNEQRHSEGPKIPKPSIKDEKLSEEAVLNRYESLGYNDRVNRTLSLMNFDKIDYDLIEHVVLHIVYNRHYPNKGSILIFLPGLAEIMSMYDILKESHSLKKAGNFKLLPLHSSLSSEDQSAIFTDYKNARKIVISTNLAETSITIDDCVFVVDAGRMKEKCFDPLKNMESLDTVWVSRANALQRKGRAGRVMSGYCFHLYTLFRYENHFRKDPVPEIQRVPLEQMILRIKILPLFRNHDVLAILFKLIEPPSKNSITAAIDRLQAVSALDESNELTPLGYHLASLPVDVRIGKLLLYGAIFQCVDSALTIAACLSYRSPFLSPFGKRDEANKKKLYFNGRSQSDQITNLKAFKAWREMAEKSFKAGLTFANENYLSVKTFQMLVSMKHQFAELLSSIGFITNDITTKRCDRAGRGRGGGDGIPALIPVDYHVNNDNEKVLKAILCASLYPNVVQILSPELKYKQTAGGAMHKPHQAEDLRFKTKDDGFVHIHPSSVNYNQCQYDSSYMVYNEKIKTSRVFIRECCIVPIYPMILFGRSGLHVELVRGQFVLSMEKGWIKFVTASQNIAEFLNDMRVELDELLSQKISNPSLDLITNPKGKLIISTIVSLITKE